MSRQRRVDFVGRLDERTVQGDGAVRFSARLSRIGVFDYGDHKEFREPREVFHPDAMASFQGIVVTEGHQGWVYPDTWRERAVGHVGDDVRRDGDYLVASVVVSHAETLAKIDSGELVEISLGYEVDLEARPGEYEGEKYDVVQHRIRGNHAGLGPYGWGRAGREVRLLDGAPTLDGMPRRIDAPGSSDASDSDPRVKRIKAVDPSFDPRGKSDTYLDTRVALLDGKPSSSPKSDREQARRDHSSQPAPAPRKNTIDEAYDRADEQARRDWHAGPPANATWTRGDASSPTHAAPTNTDGMSKIEAAHARADAEARRVHQAGPPEGALFVKR